MRPQPRAAWLLERYGFDQVYDYVDGKSDWMAFALPVEGEAGPFAGDALSKAITCRSDDPADDVLAGLDTGRDRCWS